MPYSMKKKGGAFQVRSPHGIKAKGTTKAKAASQMKLLRAADHGFKPTGRKAKAAHVNTADKIHKQWYGK